MCASKAEYMKHTFFFILWQRLHFPCASGILYQSSICPKQPSYRNGESMQNRTESVQQQLFVLQDFAYKSFHCKLIPTVAPEHIIGIRTPALRKFAKTLSKTPEAADFLRQLPHTYYEENNLHGFLIETMQDYTQAICALDAFLPYIDNWATCDLISPKIFQKHLPELYDKILLWLSAEHTYTVRFGIGMLMRFYLQDAFQPHILELVARIHSTEYYINMMIAWFFATALAKQYDAALPFLEQRRLAPWTHNKTIQKAIESHRIDEDTKTYLRTLKIKKTT